MNTTQQKKYITIDQLEQLALGAAVLGSGGGGDPHCFKLITQYQLEKHGPIEIISLDQIKPDDLVVPIACVGAPLVLLEKILSEHEFVKIFDNINSFKNKKPTVLMPAEIGGANAFTPLIAAGMLGLPVLDADLVGRAFPQLQMTSTHLNNIPAAPVVVVDSLGNSVTIESGDNFVVESITRNVTIAMGSSVVAALYMMDDKQVSKNVIPGSISQALSIGALILEARKQKVDPIQMLLDHMQGVLLATGTITDINQEIKNGFLQGCVTVVHEMQEQECIVQYQNENLIVTINGVICATTPDIIILLEQHTGAPITSELLSYGIQVSIVAFPAPEIWKTPQGLCLVGPRSFGYNVDYKPLSWESV